jgi:adenosylcobinamide-GDP ribazoletransferase
VRPFLVALQFLTVLPAPAPAEPRPSQFGWAVACFPLVGLLVGAVALAVDTLARLVWPPTVAAALVLLVGLLLTGALHFDGLLDTCDGLFLWRAERRLEVMRDSRVGGFAVAGGIAVYALKLTALAALAGPARSAALVLAPVLGRAGMAAALVLYPYARASGLGNAFMANARPVHLVTAAGSAGLLAAATGPGGLLAAAIVAMATWLTAGYVRGRLGGLTGDTYGFVDELLETLVYLTLLAAPLPGAWRWWP